MKISVCITVFNEEESIGKLLESLLAQTKKPDEIVIVDGGSTDKTVKIIRKFQKKNRVIKLRVQKCKRARGRNLGVGLAKNNIIAITDADCVADKDWLGKIVAPFKNKKTNVVAGFYKMICETSMQKAFSVFLGVYPQNFNENFLPSTRSMAFRKEICKKAGGFSESRENSAEDTNFNITLLKLGAKYARAKDALVNWKMPKSLQNFLRKIFDYAKWDAKKGEWIHPQKGKASHNIKICLIFLRYLAGLTVLILSLKFPVLLALLSLLVLLYIFWSFRKTYTLTNDFQAGLWGIVIQFTSDLAVMAGFIDGTIEGQWDTLRMP
jgi:glycosyltransferase involved in cell wall biosynthesis